MITFRLLVLELNDYKHSYAASIGYTDEFQFTLRRYGKNFNVLDEKIIGAKEFEEIFTVMNDNILAPKLERKSGAPKEMKGNIEKEDDYEQ